MCAFTAPTVACSISTPAFQPPHASFSERELLVKKSFSCFSLATPTKRSSAIELDVCSQTLRVPRSSASAPIITSYAGRSGRWTPSFWPSFSFSTEWRMCRLINPCGARPAPLMAQSAMAVTHGRGRNRKRPASRVALERAPYQNVPCRWMRPRPVRTYGASCGHFATFNGRPPGRISVAFGPGSGQCVHGW